MFNKYFKIATVIASMLVMGLITASCKEAKYEFVGKKKTNTNTPQVIVPDTPAYNFTITADPTTTKVNNPINFTGNGCGNANEGKITWQFGDGLAGEGAKVSHGYKYKGNFTVDATCVTPDGNKLTAQVVITIQATGCTNPCNNACTNPCGNPGQTPGQNQ